MKKRRLSALLLAIVLVCSMVPSALAGSIYTAKEIKVKHDFQIDGVDDVKGSATYVDVEGGYYISPFKYTVENISLTVTYKGNDYKAKTKDLKLDGLSEVKVSVYELDGKVVVSTESAPDNAEKIAKFKVDLKTWTVIAMPKTEGLEMAVKFQYKDAKPAGANNIDAYPLDASALEQAEAPAGAVQLIHDFKECKGTTDETKEIRTLLQPDANGVYFASRWDYKLATKEGDAGVGPNIDCKVVYNGANKKMKGEDITPDANNCGTMYFFDKDGKLDVDKEVPAGAALLAECTMSLDGAIWFTPKSDKITTELEFNYDAGETYDAKKNVDQVKNEKPAAAKPANPFTDVAESSPYYQGILWAVEKGVTNGTTATTFSPANPCTRAQIITFLWRAAGSPEPKSSEPAFTDVTDTGAYYYKAVQWASEQGVAAGGTFAPNNPCTRAMAVYFIWRANGSGEAGKTSFTDMPETADYADAVNWAVEKGVTKGTTETTFSPDTACTRGQIATFLFRAAQAAEKAEG